MTGDSSAGRRATWTRATTLGLGAVLLATEAYFFLLHPVGLPATPLSGDSFLVDALTRGHRVSQTIRVGAAGFHEIRVRPAPLAPGPSGSLTLALYAVGPVEGEEQLVYRTDVPVADLLREPTFAFRFPAVDRSAGRLFRLDVWSPRGRPSPMVGLWASEGRWSGSGSMFVNGQEAFAELVFETGATDVTVWARLRQHFDAPELAVILLLAAGLHAALVPIATAVWAMSDEPSGP